MDTDTDTDEIGYVAFVRGVDRTGTLTSIATAISTRGISCDSFATNDFRSGTAAITAVFRTSERLQKALARTLERLPAVHEVTILPLSDERVHASAVLILPDNQPFHPPVDVTLRWSGDPTRGQPVLMEGQFAQVQATVESSTARGASLVAMAILPPHVLEDHDVPEDPAPMTDPH
ncbi:hypothetical protein [Branchiibius sp. NY16-3462-2]|uniref:hypothetical protein n=1 Tax=Branchiibius sp. NY16-3462-2 TaxID=1807500 RepID=UPI00079B7715|nr:hypothetical protein [Branchiibius sp. NY16-3462-2]KYH44626.1 hypothetical protein AZH51_00170 [Branchiibius sp. NY16-3462-2]